MVLNIISWNARGLLNVEKFEKMKELCKEANVILLQETNWKKIEDFKSRWNGDVFYNNGDDSGRGSGLAILTKRDGCGQVKVIYDCGYKFSGGNELWGTKDDII